MSLKLTKEWQVVCDTFEGAHVVSRHWTRGGAERAKRDVRTFSMWFWGERNAYRVERRRWF